jgi:hypothetical protein
VDKVTALSKTTATGGRLNIDKAVRATPLPVAGSTTQTTVTAPAPVGVTSITSKTTQKVAAGVDAGAFSHPALFYLPVEEAGRKAGKIVV